MFDNTIKIESELVAGNFSHLIINKSSFQNESATWAKAKNTRYYGHFFTALEDFILNPQHSIFIFNAGDPRWSDISGYTARLEQIFNENLNVGVVAPNQTNDPFTGKGSFVAESSVIPGLHLSTVINGIFVALSRDVAEIMHEYMTWAMSRGIDFYSMVSGWGLDYAYCAASTYMNKYVYKDTTITMDHPLGSGYNYNIANNEWFSVLKSFMEFWQEKGNDHTLIKKMFNLFRKRVDSKEPFELTAEELYLNAKSKLVF